MTPYGNMSLSGEQIMAQARTHKRCRTCGEIKPLTDFEYRKDGKGGRRTVCLVCRVSGYRYRRYHHKKLHPHAQWLKDNVGR